MKTIGIFLQALFFSCLLFCPAGSPLLAAEYPFGLLLVGPANDHGWSQAHFEAGQAMEKVLPGAKMLYIDKVNPRPAGNHHPDASR